MKILIAAKDINMAKNMKNALEGCGHEIVIAPNSRGAITLSKKNSFDLGIVEQGDMNASLRLLDRLAQPQTGFIVLTSPGSIKRALGNGKKARIISYESIPLEVDRLLNTVRLVEEQRRRESKLRACQKRLRAAVVDLSLAEEVERRRLATELHDRVGQSLSLSKSRLSALAQSLPNSGGKQRLELAEIQSFLSGAIHDLRSLMFEISPPSLYEFGLEAAVQEMANQLLIPSGVLCTCNCDGQCRPESNDGLVLLYQSIRELLTNIASRGKARHVNIDMATSNGITRVAVEDDDVDMNREIALRSGRQGGMGLFGLRARLKPIGGRVRIEFTPGKGTRFIITAPLVWSDSGNGHKKSEKQGEIIETG